MRRREGYCLARINNNISKNKTNERGVEQKKQEISIMPRHLLFAT